MAITYKQSQSTFMHMGTCKHPHTYRVSIEGDNILEVYRDNILIVKLNLSLADCPNHHRLFLEQEATQEELFKFYQRNQNMAKNKKGVEVIEKPAAPNLFDLFNKHTDAVEKHLKTLTQPPIEKEENKTNE